MEATVKAEEKVTPFDLFLQEAYERGLLFEARPEDEGVFVYHVFGKKLFGPKDKQKTREMIELLSQFIKNQNTYFLRLTAYTCDLDEDFDVVWKSRICCPFGVINLGCYLYGA